MNAALARQCARLRRLLLDPVDVRARYAIGQTIANIKAQPVKYGSGAVRTLALELEEDVPSLYRYATVAECWSAPQFEALLRRGGKQGRRLSWSHLVLIAALPSPFERARWMDRALDEGLSVRELAASLTQSAEDVTERPRRTFAGDLASVARATERWLAETHQALSQGDLPGRSLTQEETEAVERAVSVVERMVQRGRDHVGRIRSGLGIRGGAPVRQSGEWSQERLTERCPSCGRSAVSGGPPSSRRGADAVPASSRR